ncbi:MAG TPA: rRNA maturation RNase YbeY [Bacteroidales bacterium]|jgi:rRNA maturation RNase YbeY|nr:rRNA maturation RNase YbeY [Bacteroidales bacterium]HQN24337.1 rRNA maturation RNase YbeY [Bacteroidales bacterium]HQP79157.1 rRNA maturation RNase YbeY [Bacteroidales bacterium]
MINYFNEEITFNLTRRRTITKWLRITALERGIKVGQLNYIFCSNSFLLRINRDFLGHDYFTDIITFDYSPDYELQYGSDSVSGDIYISIDTVRKNAEIYGEGFERELHRVIVHGLLHLLGFDDVTPELQAEMRLQEEIALEKLSSMLDS